MGKTRRRRPEKRLEIRDESPRLPKNGFERPLKPRPIDEARKKLEREQRYNGPHFTGKESVLFYAKQSQTKDKHCENGYLASVVLPRDKREEIKTILNSTVGQKFFDDKHDTDDNLVEAPKEPHPNTSLDVEFRRQHFSKLDDQRYLEMLKQRMKLPAFNMKDDILRLVSENVVSVINGETGCGKTTQVPQIILDDFLIRGIGSECRVLCTQPNRISAICAAQRVADERAESLGISVGYLIRFERECPRDFASICFCTPEVVLEMMQSDPVLSSVSHLILDEVHERDVMSDVILALVKEIKDKTKHLKVILMSATLNEETFSKYYNIAPYINIVGVTFPVQEFYLEDVLLRTGFEFPEKNISEKKLQKFSRFIEPHVKDLKQSKKYNQKVCKQLRNPLSEEVNLELILNLLINICQKEEDGGSILVFLTDTIEISFLSKLITDSKQFPIKKYMILPLHSLIPTHTQKQIFKTPPKGQRKIILATNIAETSITIDDVVYVIDCGKIRLADFNVETSSYVLTPKWVSLVNANQRRGCAGRVKPGFCFHLFSKARKVLLKESHPPEILRRRLENVILTTKAIRLGEVATFFAQMMDPPDKKAVTLSLNLLEQMNILAKDEILTPLGYHVAKLPMSPQVAKMVIFGAIFSCVDPILSVATSLDYKDPFILPMEKKVQNSKLRLSGGSDSDHLLVHEALKGFESSAKPRDYCSLRFLSYQTMVQLLQMKKQFMQCLYDMNFVDSVDPKNASWNQNSSNVSLVKAIICAGLYPNIAVLRKFGNHPVWSPDFKFQLNIHQKSILANRTFLYTNILVYYRKVPSYNAKSSYIHDCTLVHPLPIIFFDDKFEERKKADNTCIFINGSVEFLCERKTASIIQELRHKFNLFLEYKYLHPGPVVWTEDSSSFEIKILKTIMELITCEKTEEEGHS